MKKPIDPTGVARRKVERIGARAGDELDAVVVEEPLEIRVDAETIGVTMRTPGDDACLALGFLFGEGIIRSLRDVGTVSHCGKPGHDGWGNVIEVRSGPGTSLDADRILEGRRFVPISSACGVCGRQSIDDLIERCGVTEGGAKLPAELILRCVERMRAAQVRFEHTGGLHAAAAFDAAGELICCHEDVGRHNAVDKVVGDLLRFGLVGDDRKGVPPALLVVSGRAGFEIVQKAAAAQIPIVASVSAATSLSIDLAMSSGLTLIGFARGASFNVYTHPWRIVSGDGRSRLRAVPAIDTGTIGSSAAGSGGTTSTLGGEKALVDRIRTAGLSEELSLLARMFPERKAEVTPPEARPAEWSVGVQMHSPGGAVAHVCEAGSAGAKMTVGAAVVVGRASEAWSIGGLAAPMAGLCAEREEEPATLLAHVVPDAAHGAVAVPSAEEARAQESRRSLAAELVERTDKMIRKQRAATQQRQPAFDTCSRLDLPDLEATGDAGIEALDATFAEPQPSLPQTGEPPQSEPRAVLIDDRDPENPAPIFWPGGGWSTGRVR